MKEWILMPVVVIAAAVPALLGFRYWTAAGVPDRLEERVPGMSGPESRRGMMADVVADPEGTFTSFDGVPAASGESWPWFRGADRLNIRADGPSLLDEWDADGPRRLWSITLGEGHGGPAVRDGRVYVLDYDEANPGDALRCFSLADGREIWRRWYHVVVKRNHGASRSVPAVTDDTVVTIGPKGHVMCVDSKTGAFRWSIDMSNAYGAEIPNWYTAQCPLIDGDRAILAPGGSALMIAVDLYSGDLVWQTPNPNDWKMSHSSIIPMTFHGRPMYVYCALGGLVAVAADGADAGEILFETEAWSAAVVAPSPVALPDDRLFVTAGYGRGSMMFRVNEADGRFSLETLQSLEKTTFASEQQTPVYYRDHLFSILPNDAGALKKQLVCYDPDRGQAWASGNTNRFGLGPYLIADDKLFILRDDGVLVLARADTAGYVELARAKVLDGQDAWGPMALVDGKLLLRDSRELICLDVSRAQGA